MNRIGELVREIVGSMAGTNFHEGAASARNPLEELLEQPDLLAHGVERRGYHVIRSSWLYFDPQIAITIAHVPAGSDIPIHNHGTWEIVAPYRGTVEYREYDWDPGPEGNPSSGTLRVRDERRLVAGDIALVSPPPADIHGWTVLTDTYLLGVVGPDVAQTRSYFDLENQNHFLRNTSWPSVD